MKSAIPVFLGFLFLISTAEASNPIHLGSCEGSSGEISYLVTLTKTRSGEVAQVYRYRSRAGGDEWLEEVGGEIPFHDDFFEDAGEITHHLIDEGMSYEDADEASLHIVYQTVDGPSTVDASIRIFDENAEPVRLLDGSCTISNSSLAR